MNRHERRAQEKRARKLRVLEAPRECGGCTACCTVLEIPWLKKAAGVACPHERPGTGCGIYTERPEECSAFSCMWLQGLIPGEENRPDKVGLIFGSHNDILDATHVYEAFPGGLDSDAATALIDKLVAAGIALVLVDTFTGRRKLVAKSGHPSQLRAIRVLAGIDKG